MTEYLTKEEVRQWRSSLERITLEEFARRLGKVINEEKSTNDVVDKVMKDIKFDDSVKPEYQTKAEKINVIARETLVREKEIVNSVKPKSVNVEPVAKVESKTELEETIVSEEKEVKKSVNSWTFDKDKTKLEICDSKTNEDGSLKDWTCVNTMTELGLTPIFVNYSMKLVYIAMYQFLRLKKDMLMQKTEWE
jgi:hypothetical protein